MKESKGVGGNDRKSRDKGETELAKEGSGNRSVQVSLCMQKLGERHSLYDWEKKRLY